MLAQDNIKGLELPASPIFRIANFAFSPIAMEFGVSSQLFRISHSDKL